MPWTLFDLCISGAVIIRSVYYKPGAVGAVRSVHNVCLNSRQEQQKERLLFQFRFYEQEIEKLESQRCQQEHIVEDMNSRAKFLRKNLYIDQLMNTLEMMLESNLHLKDECTHLQNELNSLEMAHQKEPEQFAETNKVQPETPSASPIPFCFSFLHRNKAKASKNRKALSLKCK
ncbi:uncharacterized protein LOC144681912 isoform X3 [Cetorhinus maximus]